MSRSVGRQVNYRNPYGSLPSPAANEIPVTFWSTPAGLPVGWIGVDAAGDDSATWQTPVFDLRPDLRSSQGMSKSGVPIWDTAARLYIQIFALTVIAATTQDLRLEYREHANTTFGQITTPVPNRAVVAPGFPNRTTRDPVVPVTPFIDITSELMLGTNQPDSIVLVFEMLGEGYPIRYWQAELRFLHIGAVGPALNFQAAMY
jgi:hypothetical protein